MTLEELKSYVNSDDIMLDKVCMSYRHDYGLLSKEEQLSMRLKAKYMLEAWLKEIARDKKI